MSLTSNDVATSGIQMDLVMAEKKGKKLVEDIVKERLVEQTVPFFFDRMTRNNSKTFSHLYKCNTDNKTSDKKTIKANRRLIQ